MNIKFEKDELKINFSGNIKLTEEKVGFASSETLEGKVTQRWITVINKLTVNILILTPSQYETLRKMFRRSGIIKVTDEDGTNYRVVIESNSLSFEWDTLEDESRYYFGTLEMRE